MYSRVFQRTPFCKQKIRIKKIIPYNSIYYQKNNTCPEYVFISWAKGKDALQVAHTIIASM